jgi:hypothetical protein
MSGRLRGAFARVILFARGRRVVVIGPCCIEARRVAPAQPVFDRDQTCDRRAVVGEKY